MSAPAPSPSSVLLRRAVAVLVAVAATAGAFALGRVSGLIAVVLWAALALRAAGDLAAARAAARDPDRPAARSP